jgi:hypothetical protein
MNELKNMCTQVRPPEPRTLAEGRRRLTAVARGTATRRRVRRPFLLSGLLAGAVAASTVVAATTLGSGNSRHAPPRAAASPTVKLVAVTSPMTLASNAAALAQGSLPPKPTQWIYTKVKVSTNSNGDPSSKLGVHRVKEAWTPVNFLEHTHLEKAFQVSANGLPVRVWGWPPNLGYSYVRSLPADPDKLLATIRHNLAAMNAPSTDGPVFDTVLALMEIYKVLPADLNAALYGALARLNSVHLGHLTDLAGRQVLALYSFETGTKLGTAILIDPSTYTYAGEQRILLSEPFTAFTVDQDGTLNLRIRQILANEAVLEAKIVNSSGQR